MARSTEQKILDAAEKSFAAKGFEAASLAGIADAVGIRVPSLFNHFRTKRDLYRAVVTRLMHPYFAMLTSLLTMPRRARDAERNLEAVAEHYYTNPNLARLVQHAALAGGEDLDLLRREWFNPFLLRAKQLTPRGRNPDWATFVVISFHSMMSGYITLAPLHKPLLGREPLGKSARARHLAFLKALAGAMWGER